jgi:uncharacterized Ntn-hydrolase superfamily protein
MTYSIVARDSNTGDLGIAVQSHFFAVGRIVPWAEAGVGAIATQAFADASYGPKGLSLMRRGRSADEALEELVAKDPDRAVRQVAMVDATGRTAVHTGAKCVAAAGHAQADQVVAQGNMLASPTCWPAMINAYQAFSGDLVEKLLAALEAAENEGGDVRGRQSAAILVVSGEPSNEPWKQVTVDIRVDDHPEPVAEIARLAGYNRAYELIGNALFTTGAVTAAKPSQNAAAGALDDLEAADALLEGNREAAVWRAVVLARLGRIEEARQAVKELAADHPELNEFVRRLPEAGLVTEPIAVDPT